MVAFPFLMLLFSTKLLHCNCVARGTDTSNPCPDVVGTVGHGYTSFIILDVGACCYCNAGSYMESICLKDQPPNSRVCTACTFNSDKPDEQYFISDQPHNLTRCKLSIQTCPNGLTRINGNTTSDAQCVLMNSTTTTPLTTLPVIFSIPDWGIGLLIGFILLILLILVIVCYCRRDKIWSILRNQRHTQRSDGSTGPISDQPQNKSSGQALQTTALSNCNNATPSSDGDVADETNALLGGETQANLSVASESRSPSSDITRPDDGHLPNSHVINETSLSNGGSIQQDHPTSSNQSVSNLLPKLYKDPEDKSDDHKETVVEMNEFGDPSDAANSDLKAIPDESNFISSPDDPGTSQSPNQQQTGNLALIANDNRETQSEQPILIPYIDEGNNSRVINVGPPDISDEPSRSNQPGDSSSNLNHTPQSTTSSRHNTDRNDDSNQPSTSNNSDPSSSTTPQNSSRMELMWGICDRLCESVDYFLPMSHVYFLLVWFGYRRLNENFETLQRTREQRIQELFRLLEKDHEDGKLDNFPQRFKNFLIEKNLKHIFDHEIEPLYSDYHIEVE